MAKGFMLDTTVFNHILRDGWILRRCGRMDRSSSRMFSMIELCATDDPAKRAQLLAVFAGVASQEIATESAMWNVSKWGRSSWSPDDGVVDSMLAALNERNGTKPNNRQDILIAETALRNA